MLATRLRTSARVGGSPATSSTRKPPPERTMKLRAPEYTYARSATVTAALRSRTPGPTSSPATSGVKPITFTDVGEPVFTVIASGFEDETGSCRTFAVPAPAKFGLRARVKPLIRFTRSDVTEDWAP